MPLAPEDPPSIGPYRLTDRLGEGGMGLVYKGLTVGMRPVAIKVIHAQYAHDPRFRRRFAREVESALKVSGFYTAQLLDADPDAPSPWLATAFIDGPSLSEHVRRHGPMGAPRLRALAAALAEGLAAIHSCGLVHRDLKPGNVILSADGPRIIDFGIAVAAADHQHLTTTGAVIGTPAFMSPEQAQDETVGSPSDVFSLGTVLAFAGTGRTPFRGEGVAVLLQIVTGPPDLEGLTGEIRDLVEACLAKDPAARPSTRQLLERLAPDLQTDPHPTFDTQVSATAHVDAAAPLGLGPAAYTPTTVDAESAQTQRSTAGAGGDVTGPSLLPGEAFDPGPDPHPDSGDELAPGPAPLEVPADWSAFTEASLRVTMRCGVQDGRPIVCAHLGARSGGAEEQRMFAWDILTGRLLWGALIPDHGPDRTDFELITSGHDQAAARDMIVCIPADRRGFEVRDLATGRIQAQWRSSRRINRLTTLSMNGEPAVGVFGAYDDSTTAGPLLVPMRGGILPAAGSEVSELATPHDLVLEDVSSGVTEAGTLAVIGTGTLSGAKDPKEGVAIVWHADTGSILHRIRLGRRTRLVGVAGGTLFVGVDRSTHAWNLDTGKPRRNAVGQRVRVELSPDHASAVNWGGRPRLLFHQHYERRQYITVGNARNPRNGYVRGVPDAWYPLRVLGLSAVEYGGRLIAAIATSAKVRTTDLGPA